MDVERFDALARSLGSSSSSRRETLRALLAGALFGSGSLPGAAAACKPPGAKCTRTSQCCSGRCKKKGKKTGTCRGGNGCPTGQQPCNGGCIPLDQCCGGCPQGETCCSFADGGRCLDLFYDHDHCGHCTGGCDNHSLCLHGGCTNSCSGPNSCPGGCGCYEWVGGVGGLIVAVCGFDQVLNCDEVDACDSDDDCGFGEGCFAGACAGKNVCLSTHQVCI